MWQPSYGSLKAEHVGYVWTGKFDLNTDTCVDVEIFESEKKKFQIQKYPDTLDSDVHSISDSSCENKRERTKENTLSIGKTKKKQLANNETASP